MGEREEEKIKGRGRGRRDRRTHTKLNDKWALLKRLPSLALQTRSRLGARQRLGYGRVKLRGYQIPPPWSLWEWLPRTEGGKSIHFFSFFIFSPWI